MEWEAPAVVLEARPHGEGGAVVSVLTEEFGRHAGLVKGGASRGQAALWMPGNLIEARWVGRLPEQLGALSGELVHAAAALAMADPLATALLSSCCAIAADALPEREAHGLLFHDTVALVATLARDTLLAVPDAVRWELRLLQELGYGLDLSACAVTGEAEVLPYVSPKSGRAVSEAGAGLFRDRLLPLPAFLRDDAAASGPADWAAGLRLTGVFLARDVFGARNRGMPGARDRFADRVCLLASAGAGD
ncbi:DNA replication and repair protein RecO [Humitalea rosea]|uniref:DNA repair protein RecO n=1 Tax=Humitalea rosea TaxID=990373 RepID=A0A2W7INS3_9PROT|nr:DNA repair protein RecO [Humitalea rosea]PZW48704.1 DNA replication and repair protein RecO [Humitalea rosea]